VLTRVDIVNDITSKILGEMCPSCPIWIDAHDTLVAGSSSYNSKSSLAITRVSRLLTHLYITCRFCLPFLANISAIIHHLYS